MVSPQMLYGEAGTCGFWAMVAVAHVYQRNRRMNGWQDPPEVMAVLAALLWPLFPDMTDGAVHVFSADDLAGAARVVVGDAPPLVLWPCKQGALAFY